ncbi:MAG: hypothetical protein AAGH99_15310 [Planctomycetota bacterium]
MSQGAHLLRLLEPTVRPVSPVKPISAPAKGALGELPFEAQDFDTLLASARETGNVDEADTTTAADAGQPKPTDPLNALADLGRIENPGLRELLAEQRTASNQPDAA